MPLKKQLFFKVYGKYFIMENDSQFGYPVGHEFAFYFRWVDYTDFPVGDYVTCNGNKATKLELLLSVYATSDTVSVSGGGPNA